MVVADPRLPGHGAAKKQERKTLTQIAQRRRFSHRVSQKDKIRHPCSTAATIFHKTRTPLCKWFIAAYLIAHDKRGVSALYISRELAIRYDSAWLMCHKLRHSLTESATDFLLDDYVEVDEAFYGGRKQKGNRGRRRPRTPGEFGGWESCWPRIPSCPRKR